MARRHSPRPAACHGGLTRHSHHLPRPMSLAAARGPSPAITRRGPSFTSHSQRLAAAPSHSHLRRPEVRVTRRRSEFELLAAAGRHSLRPASLAIAAANRYSPMPAVTRHGPPSLAAARVTRRGPSPGHSGVAVRRHSARPATGNRRGPRLLAAARRHSQRPVVRVTAARRGLTRHGPLVVIQARRGPSHSPRRAITRRGRTSFTSLSHSPRRRPSRQPRL